MKSNRHKILETNEYDFLLGLNKELLKRTSEQICIKDLLEKERCVCKHSLNCEKCLQDWLNEPA